MPFDSVDKHRDEDYVDSDRRGWRSWPRRRFKIGGRRSTDNARPSRMTLTEQRKAVGPDGWTCHVCRNYRPDRLIGVYQVHEQLVGGAVMTQNIRYCLDREECIAGAPGVSFIGEADGS